VEGDGGEVRKEKIAARRHGKTGELFFSCEAEWDWDWNWG